MNTNGTLNVEDMNYLLDKLTEVANILEKLQVQIDCHSLRLDVLEKKPC